MATNDMVNNPFLYYAQQQYGDPLMQQRAMDEMQKQYAKRLMQSPPMSTLATSSSTTAGNTLTIDNLVAAKASLNGWTADYVTYDNAYEYKQYAQGVTLQKRFKFPALNGFSTYDEGAEINGVDLLRHRCARWLGTVVAS